MNATQRADEAYYVQLQREIEILAQIRAIPGWLDADTYRARVSYILNRPQPPQEMRPWLLH